MRHPVIPAPARFDGAAGRPPGPDEPSVRVELAGGEELGALAAPLGISPTGDGPADERRSMAIDADQVVVRSVEPVGVAHGLTTLLQLLAATRPPTRPRSRWTGADTASTAHGWSLDFARRPAYVSARSCCPLWEGQIADPVR